VHSIKDRYVIRSQHAKTGSVKFIPPNASEAKSIINQKLKHPDGDSQILFEETEKINKSIMRKEASNADPFNGQINHKSTFLATSPVTQDQNLERPRATLNDSNEYGVFMTTREEHRSRAMLNKSHLA